MSVVALPRTPARARTAPKAPATHVRRRRLSTSAKLWMIATFTAAVVLAGNAYVAQRQVELSQLQSQLLQAQSRYANKVAGLTNLAAPARVAAEAGRLHLVEPTQVMQIPAASLTQRLPLAHVEGTYQVSTRSYQ